MVGTDVDPAVAAGFGSAGAPVGADVPRLLPIDEVRTVTGGAATAWTPACSRVAPGPGAASAPPWTTVTTAPDATRAPVTRARAEVVRRVTP
ncbi:hypothetical protein GCM10027596_09080 [Nocardioides korecus]